MTKKPQRVPGMRETRPNRVQRRHPDSPPENEPLVRDAERPTEVDVPDPRTKAGGHKKKTADHWNQ